jgi:hypothetical protein
MSNGRLYKVGFEERIWLGSTTDEVTPRRDLPRREIRDRNQAGTQAHARLAGPWDQTLVNES